LLFISENKEKSSRGIFLLNGGEFKRRDALARNTLNNYCNSFVLKVYYLSQEGFLFQFCSSTFQSSFSAESSFSKESCLPDLISTGRVEAPAAVR
jgi:hypothetical protein